MPNLPAGQEFDTVWRFRCDTRTGEYTLTVQYYSNLPPKEHEKLHDRIRREAFQWLLAAGHTPDQSKVKIQFLGRVACNQEAPAEIEPFVEPVQFQEEIEQ